VGEVLDEGFLDAEDGAADADLGVTVDEDVRDEGAHAGGGDHEVQVRGAHEEAAHGLEHLAHRPVVGDWGTASA
jgi:hypothetical protein